MVLGDNGVSEGGLNAVHVVETRAVPSKSRHAADVWVPNGVANLHLWISAIKSVQKGIMFVFDFGWSLSRRVYGGVIRLQLIIAQNMKYDKIQITSASTPHHDSIVIHISTANTRETAQFRKRSGLNCQKDLQIGVLEKSTLRSDKCFFRSLRWIVLTVRLMRVVCWAKNWVFGHDREPSLKNWSP